MSDAAQIDGAEEFKDTYWTQGQLLMTKVTRRWTKERQERAEFEERKRAFAYFRERDEGRSRVLVAVYDTPEECAAAVAEHNKERFKRMTPSAPSET